VGLVKPRFRAHPKERESSAKWEHSAKHGNVARVLNRNLGEKWKGVWEKQFDHVFSDVNEGLEGLSCVLRIKLAMVGRKTQFEGGGTGETKKQTKILIRVENHIP